MKNLTTMVKEDLYSAFVNNCLCLNCPRNKKIIRDNGTVKKIVSCSSFRNKPKSYISWCKDWDVLKPL